VILVAVREDDGLDVADALPQRAEIRQDEIDAQHLGRGEHEPHVDDRDPTVELDDGHVLADLAEPAEREDAKAQVPPQAGPPTPPCSRHRRNEASFPASRSRPGIGPRSSSFACLTATTFGISASSARTSGGRLITVRDGML